jgi:gliding motility-associated-like protein
MRVVSISMLLLFLFATVKSQLPAFQWAKSFSGTNNEYCNDQVLDALGNIYTVGSIKGTTDMDPGPGTYNLTSMSIGYDDIYICKLTSLGEFVWAKRIGGLFNDIPTAIDIDNNGNLYIGGTFHSTVDFDPGAGVSNLSNGNGGTANFLLKLDLDGNFIFAKKVAGSLYFHSLRSLAMASSGNIYVTGTFAGTSDFDPGPGVFNLSTAILTNSEFFLSKYDSDGNLIWAKQFAGDNLGSSYAIDVDALENIYVAGVFYGTCDFNPGPSIFNLTSSISASGSVNADIFVTKLNSNGDLVFAKQITGLVSGNCWDMCVDPLGNILMTGDYKSVTDFDPGPAIYSLDPGSYADCYVLKLNSLGNFVWARTFESVGQPESSSRGFSICTDSQGNIYTAGNYTGGVDFNPGSGAFVLNTISIANIFISKLNSNGDFSFALNFEGSMTSSLAAPRSITVDYFMNVVMVGFFRTTIDFNPLNEVFNITSLGGEDAFVMKLKMICALNSASTLNVFSCNSYNLNNQTYTTTGTYTQTLLNAAGCDSVITLNLTIGGSIALLSETACNSYFWEGQTYTSSGLYTATFTGSNGCDSIRKLNLTIKNSTSSSSTVSICEGQTYEGHSTSGTYVSTHIAANGCDSIRTLYLTVKPKVTTSINAVICEGSNFAGYTNTGTYTNTYVASNGCDSIRTLNLIVNPKKYKNVDVFICEGSSHFAGGMLQTTSGVYKDTLQTTLGCDSIVTTNLQVNPKPKPNLGQDRNICFGTSINLSPGVFSSYGWQNLSISPTFTVADTGLYYVTVTNSFNCSARDSIRINEIKPLPKDFLKDIDSICSYEKLIVQSLKSYSSYQWSTGESLNKINVLNAGKYWLKVTDLNGCVGIDTISVYPKNCKIGIFFPNAFTPNGDGKNDVFRPLVFGNLQSFKLEIYDRGGQLVYRTNNYQQGWNSLPNSLLYSTSAFVWQCTYQFEGKAVEFQKGTVLLVR